MDVKYAMKILTATKQENKTTNKKEKAKL